MDQERQRCHVGKGDYNASVDESVGPGDTSVDVSVGRAVGTTRDFLEVTQQSACVCRELDDVYLTTSLGRQRKVGVVGMMDSMTQFINSHSVILQHGALQRFQSVAYRLIRNVTHRQHTYTQSCRCAETITELWAASEVLFEHV